MYGARLFAADHIWIASPLSSAALAMLADGGKAERATLTSLRNDVVRLRRELRDLDEQVIA